MRKSMDRNFRCKFWFRHNSALQHSREFRYSAEETLQEPLFLYRPTIKLLVTRHLRSHRIYQQCQLRTFCINFVSYKPIPNYPVFSCCDTVMCSGPTYPPRGKGSLTSTLSSSTLFMYLLCSVHFHVFQVSFMMSSLLFTTSHYCLPRTKTGKEPNVQ